MKVAGDQIELAGRLVLQMRRLLDSPLSVMLHTVCGRAAVCAAIALVAFVGCQKKQDRATEKTIVIPSGGRNPNRIEIVYSLTNDYAKATDFGTKLDGTLFSYVLSEGTPAGLTVLVTDSNNFLGLRLGSFDACTMGGGSEGGLPVRHDGKDVDIVDLWYELGKKNKSFEIEKVTIP